MVAVLELLSEFVIRIDESHSPIQFFSAASLMEEYIQF